MAEDPSARRRPEPPDAPIDHFVRYLLLAIIIVPITYSFVQEFVSNWFL